jgi:membrane protein YdbS with pleckstrin-like domain
VEADVNGDGGGDVDETYDAGPAVLREPAHRASQRAIGYWRLGAATTTAVVGTPVLLVSLAAAGVPWWVRPIGLVVVVALVVWTVVMPTLRYRVHRWEVTPTAVHTRAGWLSIDQRIAPLSRVQTVDSAQGPVMRLFGLRSITVTTASAAGPITISCLDDEVARRVVADLTAITGASPGDAT